MKNKVLMCLATLMMVAFLTGCGKAPQAQIDAVNAAIEAAKTVLKQMFIFRMNSQLFRNQ